MATFSPIAIVGRACVLPGALSPEALWDVVSQGRDAVRSAPPERWGTDPAHVFCDPANPEPDKAWSDRGGFVEGFAEVFDPEGFGLPADAILRLDPLFQWVLHTAREALRDSGFEGERGRLGAVFGNLSFPSQAMSRYAEAVWRGDDEAPDPRNRFSSGLPALILERALGLGAGAFALDAACASSLYAIKTACDWLHDRRGDLVLAGAVNRADPLFIHVGFSALQALSKSGQSRPFHADADGLIPAEGAGFVALRRLEDAERDGDTIHGVICAVGLSNDGQGRGFLVPSAEGQTRALRSAYAQAGLTPADISLVECHATGTTLGDATELRGLAEVFDGHATSAAPVPLGSLKSNLGHLITAAGVAGLIKVCEAMRVGERPRTLHVEEPNRALEGTPFRLLTETEPWSVEGPRRAAVSAFGFGGCNAHLIVEQHQPGAAIGVVPAQLSGAIAIVGMGITAADCSGRAAFAAGLADGRSHLRVADGDEGALEGRADAYQVDGAALRMPPTDLKQTLSQQLLMLEAGREAAAEVNGLPRERTGVFVGMGVDAEVARYGARWRHGEGYVDTLGPAGVIGTMPNIVANRLNRALDLGGASCSVSAEERSGIEALQLAVRALRAGELDAAIVGAVDLCCEPVQRRAAEALLPEARRVPGDAAVALVVKRLADAERDGDRIYAIVDEGGVARAADVWGPGQAIDLTPRFGHAHAASGLLHVAAAALGVHQRRRADGRPWVSGGVRQARVVVDCMEGPTRGEVLLREAPEAVARPEGAATQVRLYTGPTREAVLDALAQDRRSALDSDASGARLVLIADSDAGFEARAERARTALAQGAQGPPAGAGVYFREAPVTGELGFVFTSAGSAYAGMGGGLLADLPELGDALAARFRGLPDALAWVFDDGAEPSAEQRLWAASALTQLHAELSMGLLGLRPTAALGYSSGESNSLFAFGAWRDMDAMRRECQDAGLFTRELGGEFQVVKRQWGADATWEMWSVLAPLGDVRAAVAAEPRVHVAIVHGANDCVIGGDAAGCARVANAVGPMRCQRLDYSLCVHVPELDEHREAWLQAHRRETFAVPGVRFYSGAFDAAYAPERERCAEAILGQANACLDFPAMVEAAWRDGVRVFVEHGPGGSCARWIREALGTERLAEAVVVSLDRRGGGADQIFECVGALLAAGVRVDVGRLLKRLRPAEPRPVANNAAAALILPAHPAPVNAAHGVQVMKPAPTLPPILDDAFVVALHAPIAEAPEIVELAAVRSVPAAAVDPRAEGIPQLADLAAVHTRFLQQQAEVHQRFLASRTHMQRLAMGYGDVAPAPPIVPPNPPKPVSVVAAVPVAPAMAPAPAPTVKAAQPPAPAPVPTAPTAPAAVGTYAPRAPQPTGLTLTREQLEIDASGNISEIFGPLFTQQDGYVRQVRMPMPPLLLADRVTGLDAEPGVAGVGTIWTETDVKADSWYLHRGRMPGGIFIESGQADLMLISWMGADFLNKSERVYRLLGCTLTFEGDLPAPGDTLRYDIHVDGHARHEDVRLFFFHYDCRIDGEVRLAVRDGQAGFFSDADLAASVGILWTPKGADIVSQPHLDPPDQLSERRSFDRDAIRAFADGRPWDCFGAGFEGAQTHSHTPAIQGGRMLFLDEVTHFEPNGGPWERGYLRARALVKADDWYFAGHFHNDPCMPGTLMFEGCFQALSLYLTGLGYTLKRDGWRFQPVAGEPIVMKCRGQVTPSSKETVYEVFVEEIIAGPEPTIYADLLCSVDGLKAFHAKRVGLRLVPDWPLNTWTELLADYIEPKPVASVATPDGGSFAFGYESLLSCAWGKPSKAFGPMYAPFDGHRTAPRLPGPPYHFMSRIVSVDGPIGVPKAGAKVVVEYDVAPDAWYLADNGCRTMPFAVLLEAALQPCGWLASYIGSVMDSPIDLLFRNLDGTGTQRSEVFEDAGCLRTEVVLTRVSKAGGMVIVAFDVEMTQGGRPVYDLKTVFGCFPASAFEDQAGLPISESDRALLERPSDFLLDLDARPAPFYRGPGVARGTASLPDSKLDMLNRIDGWWPEGGAAGLGAMRAVKDVRTTDWYFKAHFFQDPVQPGSLGIEAMIQLLQAYMLQTGMDVGVVSPRFEPLELGRAMTWKYRGQVVPTNERVTCTLELTERGADLRGPFAVCDASLWVDGLRIYSATDLGMRIVSGGVSDGPKGGVVLDPKVDIWLADHCPTWNRPALPMMSVVDLLAAAVPGNVTAVKDVKVNGWLDFAGPRSFRCEVEARGGEHVVRLFATAGSDAETEAASGRVVVGEFDAAPAAWEPMHGGDALGDPYASGELFHGPAFRLLTAGRRDAHGASFSLDAGAGSVPIGRLHPALLDAALHGIPHDRLHIWSDKISEDRVAYPARVPELRFYGPTPTEGAIRCEVRFDGFLMAPDLPAFRFQLITADDRVWAEGRLIEACFPKGRLGQAPAEQRRAFLHERSFVAGLTLSRTEDGATRLSQAEVAASDWMPGTIEGIYGTSAAEEVAVREHRGQREGIHPGRVHEALPLNGPGVSVSREGDDVVVRDADAASRRLQIEPLRAFWEATLGQGGPSLRRDLWEGLLQRFVRRVVLEDPSDFERLKGRGALFLGNHQVQIESLLITYVLSGLTRRPVVTIANAKHEQRWIGRTLRHLFGYPGSRDPGSIVYFDQQRRESMFELLDGLRPELQAGTRSLFLHPQGTRSRTCRDEVTTVSSAFLDLAVALELPVVPVRFSGGLPVAPTDGKLEFPVRYAAQDYWVGRAIEPAELAELPYAERRVRVCSALNGLGSPVPAEEVPHPADEAFGERVAQWQRESGASEVDSVFLRVLESAEAASPETRALLARVHDGAALPDSLEGRWLQTFATRLSGPASTS